MIVNLYCYILQNGVKSMKVIITGGNGRAGSYIVKEFLDNHYEVVNADLTSPNFIEPTDKQIPNLSFKKIDFTDFGQTLSAIEGCDAIVHLAAIPNPMTLPPHEVFRINMMSTYNVLESAFLLNIKKIVLASSINAIGAAFPLELWGQDPIMPKYLPVDENHPTRASDVYATTKWLGEEMAEAFTRRYDVQISSLRFMGLWDENRLLNHKKDENKDTITSRKISGFFSYTDRRDAAKACRLSIEKDWIGHEAFFIASSDTTSNINTSELVKIAYPEVKLNKNFQQNESLISISKAKKIMNWEPEYSWRNL